MNIVGVVYRDSNLDIKKYEKFLAEISKFDIIGEPIFSGGEYLLYRALVKCKSLVEKKEIDALTEKYKVRVC